MRKYAGKQQALMAALSVVVLGASASMLADAHQLREVTTFGGWALWLTAPLLVALLTLAFMRRLPDALGYSLCALPALTSVVQYLASQRAIAEIIARVDPEERARVALESRWESAQSLLIGAGATLLCLCVFRLAVSAVDRKRGWAFVVAGCWVAASLLHFAHSYLEVDRIAVLAAPDQVADLIADYHREMLAHVPWAIAFALIPPLLLTVAALLWPRARTARSAR